MKKNNFHKFNIFLLVVLFLALFSFFSPVKAQEGTTFTPQTGIPGSEFEAGQVLGITGRSFIDYLVAFYQWAVGAIAILAVVMIMVAGFQWMAAAGNAALIGKAKNRISNSLVGLLLAVGAYSLLNFINPSLVNLRTLDLEPIEYLPLFTSEVSCENGYITYTWDGYYCYDMPGYSTYESQYYPIDDFVDYDDLLENSELTRGADMKLDLGVHAARIANCDAQNDFGRFLRPGIRADTAEGIVLTYDPPAKMNHSLTTHRAAFTSERTGINLMLNYDEYDGARIPLLEGLNVNYTGRTDGGLSSAYVRNIVVQTKKFCAVCCQSEDEEGEIDFVKSNKCPQGAKEIEPSACCVKYEEKDCPDLLPYQCGGVEKFCDFECHWHDAAVQGGQGYCGTI
ncbi:pilin [Patescibacteria group bacterium]|nr:pilin [Patescibacteria group bacterium]